MNAEFVPGVELARRYYGEVVRPLLDAHVPGLAHSAALIGWGSDVLGFDTARSTDHNWGPRCQVFLGPADAGQSAAIGAMLSEWLPETFLHWPTRFPDVTAAGQPVRHWVEVSELGSWLTGMLGFDPRPGVAVPDWLAVPAQRLAEITGGAVFHDGLASDAGPGRGREPGRGPGRGRGPARGRGPGRGLEAARAAVAWYPDDVWRYVLACQWQRIGQEEAFPGRCAEAGDDLGSIVVTARLIRELIRLVLLMNRRYPPYSKWLGSAFARVPGAAADLGPALTAAATAGAWPERERRLGDAYQAVGRMHNELGLTDPVEVATRWYFDRPYQVPGAERYVTALTESMTDPGVRRLPLVGTVDQFIDSTDALGDAGRLHRAAAVFHDHPVESANGAEKTGC